jgi:hypothetical protein
VVSHLDCSKPTGEPDPLAGWVAHGVGFKQSTHIFDGIKVARVPAMFAEEWAALTHTEIDYLIDSVPARF